MAVPGASPDTSPLHATTVAHAGRAALIQGPAGSGKSGLALQMIAMGARLVADDRTVIRRRGDQVIAEAPDSLRGQIEARGVGILAAPPAGPTPVALIIDMTVEETERLPPLRETELLGVILPLQRKVNMPHFPVAILAYLKHGRIA
ncbi:HPr kinase/phosphorylase [uncultured Roseovarius sp.]|uniref:HPr kinase/phosphorylase n=1 Tax=uncultured Roseovarius sp. TaxID=293344 RepID=UPI0026258E54|nr:HPr kinase/phosphatase C-terminal domain-containing protein [uncultured Roseovarius sp.]